MLFCLSRIIVAHRTSTKSFVLYSLSYICPDRDAVIVRPTGSLFARKCSFSCIWYLMLSNSLYSMQYTVIDIWVGLSISYKIACAPDEYSGQPAHPWGLISLRCPSKDAWPWDSRLPTACPAKTDPTALIRRLTWVFAGHIWYFMMLCPGSYSEYLDQNTGAFCVNRYKH